MDPFDLRLWKDFAQAGGSLMAPAIVDQIAIDSRRIYSPYSLFVALKGEREDGHLYIRQAAEAGAKYALVSNEWQCQEELKINLLRVPNPLKAFQEIVKTYRLQLSVKIIGVTGSFGKTMVKDLLLPLLSTQKKVAASPESFNSQIGVALSLLTLHKDHEIAVIEAAISQTAEMDALVELIRPDYTILTPLGNKHLATLQNLSILTTETLKLIQATPKAGWSLLPSQVLPQYSLADHVSPTYCWDLTHSHLPHAIPLFNEPILSSSYSLSFPDQSKFEGKMAVAYSYYLNLINIASKAAWLSGISSHHIQEVLHDYQPEPTRTEIWKAPAGTIFINDTYCSDPQSVDNALNFYKLASPNQKKIFVFGGMRGESLRSQHDYRRIGKALSKANLKNLFLLGDKPFTPLIEEMEKHSQETEITAFYNQNELFTHLQDHIHADDLILFKGDKKFSLDHLTETFNESQNNNQCVINLAAIQNNLRMIRSRLPSQTRIMFMVKALAYGTDDVRMAKFLSTCSIDILGVSYVDEGIALKRAGVDQEIFSLNAALYEVGKVVKWDLEVGASDREFIIALADEATRQNKIIKVHLHINTGMGRFGCPQAQVLELAALINDHTHLTFEGIMTHFACADDPLEDSFTLKQISTFDACIELLNKNGFTPYWKHAANSSGAIRFSLPQYNMVRIGLAAYGLYVSDAVKKEVDLRLSLSLSSRIVGINVHAKGESISYGRRYRIERENQRIAVLPIGYFDGIHRKYSGKATVLIQGRKAPMVGSICMDYMMVDVSDIPEAQVGDRVLIFGEDEYGQYLSPEALAESGDSIIHELITCLGPRIQRVFVYEEGCQIR
ncbi:MAG: bifunctional UDP-N-acetylmuramoyl-tripeptide:D-alanyl-D-alanine ligase/alanine racemase [Candidatus Protochlamydia sp.]|nr:bifunctional UDP-N-acetylmuramoyl-tripeptide:D-alanyl-D-alanine ligase/alanine racemase [Candidatus Protochlamydia sp.]